MHAEAAAYLVASPPFSFYSLRVPVNMYDDLQVPSVKTARVIRYTAYSKGRKSSNEVSSCKRCCRYVANADDSGHDSDTMPCMHAWSNRLSLSYSLRACVEQTAYCSSHCCSITHLRDTTVSTTARTAIVATRTIL